MLSTTDKQGVVCSLWLLQPGMRLLGYEVWLMLMAGLRCVAEYYLQTSAWADVHPSQLLGPPCLVKEYDLLQVSLEELAAPLQVSTAGPACSEQGRCCSHFIIDVVCPNQQRPPGCTAEEFVQHA